MEKYIIQIEILRVVQYIIWLISLFWLGYEIGQQKIIKDLMKKDLQRLKKYEYSRISETNNR